MNKKTLKSIAKGYSTTLPLVPATLFIASALSGMVHTKSKIKNTLLAGIIGLALLLPEIVYTSFLETKLEHANERAEEHFGEEYKDWIFKEKPE